MAGGRAYFDVVTIDVVNYLTVTADPNGTLAAPAGSHAQQSTTPRTEWINTDGATAWRRVFPNQLFDAIVASDGTGTHTSVSAAFTSGAVAVFVRDGTYVETSNIVLPADGKLVGESTGGAIIVLAAGSQVRIDGSARRITAGTITYTNGSTAVVGVGTTFTTLIAGDYISLGGVFHQISSITNATNLVLSQTYRGVGAGGVAFVGQSMLVGASVESLVFANATTTAVHLLQVLHVVLRDVLVVNATGTGLLVEKSSGIALETFLVEEGAGNGIDVFETQGLRAIECVVKNRSGIGIRIRGAPGSQPRMVTVGNSLVVQCGGSGISIEDTSSEISVADTAVIQCAGIGGSVATTTTRIILDGSFSCTNGLAGLSIGGIDYVVSDCTMKSNGMVATSPGILALGLDGSITGCHLGFNTGWGIDTTGSTGEIVIGDNMVSANGAGGGGGIRVTTDCTVVGNISRANTGSGIEVTGTDTVVNGNRCKTNTVNGVNVTATAVDAIVTSNNLQGNTGASFVDAGALTISANNKV